MRFLIVGSGGREHALAWKLAASDQVTEIFVAPGNAGTAQEAKTTNLPVASDNIDGLLECARTYCIDYTVVGPELPLSLGIVDRFQRFGLRCFGVNQQAAQLESSKLFAKKLLQKYAIPTADYRTFNNYHAAVAYCGQAQYPLVIKADGLAAGKGVTIATDTATAFAALEALFIRRVFGNAGNRVVIEEYLQGFETSVIAIVNGTSFVPFVDVQDHKRLGDSDTGPNTGGMGAFSPASRMTDERLRQMHIEVLRPLLAAIAAEDIDYQGFLFIGMMIVDEQPHVLEINCRLGDPEAQVIMLRLQSDLADLLIAASDDKLSEYQIQWSKQTALCVVLAAEGYPEFSQKGAIIPHFNGARHPDIAIFHAGTAYNSEGQLVVAGGRVLNVCTLATTPQYARRTVYQVIDTIAWPGCQYRKDILAPHEI